MPASPPAPASEQHPEHRHGVEGLAAEHRVVGRHVAPAEDGEALLGGDLLDVAGALRRWSSVGRNAMPHGVGAGGRQFEVDDGPQEPVGHLDEDAGAVADVGLGVGGAPVVEVAQRREAEADDLVAAPAVHVGDEADAAGVVLEARVVEALRSRARACRHFVSSRFRARQRTVECFGAAVRGRRWPSGNGSQSSQEPVGGQQPQWSRDRRRCRPLRLHRRLPVAVPRRGHGGAPARRRRLHPPRRGRRLARRRRPGPPLRDPRRRRSWPGPSDDPADGWRIVGAHTDSPNLRIKPRPDTGRAGARQLAVEPYGGVLLNSWLGRDLGLSGRVALTDGSLRAASRSTSRCCTSPSSPSTSTARSTPPGCSSTRSSTSCRSGASAPPDEGGFRRVPRRAARRRRRRGRRLGRHDPRPRAVRRGRPRRRAACRRRGSTTSARRGRRSTASSGAGTGVVALWDHEEIGSETNRGAGSPLLADGARADQRAATASRCTGRWPRRCASRPTWPTPRTRTTPSGTSPATGSPSAAGR